MAVTGLGQNLIADVLVDNDHRISVDVMMREGTMEMLTAVNRREVRDPSPLCRPIAHPARGAGVGIHDIDSLAPDDVYQLLDIMQSLEPMPIIDWDRNMPRSRGKNECS